MRKFTALAATFSAATALVGLGAGTAFADPSPSGTVPNSAAYVAVGSDTVQFLWDKISPAWNSSALGTTHKLYSWDAVAPSGVTDNCNGTGTAGQILTKTGATCITRPNGSGAGITALNGNTKATVDFARSSSGPNGNTADTFVAYAGDAVTAAKTRSVTGTGGPAALDIADLKAIYTCSATKWSTLPDDPGTSTETIKPFLPQISSGTGKFFLNAIGMDGTARSDVGSCVNQSVEENEGDFTKLSTTPGYNASLHLVPDVVFPYSVAVGLAQSLHASADGITTTTGAFSFPKMKGVSGDTPVLPYKASGSTFIINSAMPAAFQRLIYNVVRTDTSSGTGSPSGVPAYLNGLLAPAASGGALCKYGTSLLQDFGFLPLGSACGTATVG